MFSLWLQRTADRAGRRRYLVTQLQIPDIAELEHDLEEIAAPALFSASELELFTDYCHCRRRPAR